MLDEDAIFTLANLVHIMLADGVIDRREERLVHDAAQRLGLGETPSIEELLNVVLAGDGSFSDSRGPQVCLAECLLVAASDGAIHPAETRAWKQLAISFGYSVDTTEAAMQAGCKAIESGDDPFDAIRTVIEQEAA